ncbi:MAG: hypothetical protein KDD73_15255 [Anaerolineales bacterium]|nr:hypothetical protein [Anaerolineales bacterium]
MKRTFIAMVALLLFAFSGLTTYAQGDAAAAASWIAAQIGADGGFGDGFSEGSSLSATVDAVLAGTAAGQDVSSWGSDRSPLDLIATNADQAATVGLQAKTVLAAVASGQAPRDFGGVDLLTPLNDAYDADSGSFGGMVTDHALAILAWHAVGEAIPTEAVDALKALQGEDGGWSFDGSSQSDTNTTGLALQALAAAGDADDSQVVSAALDYLRGQQNEDGGFPYQNPSDFGTESDANSTAWVVQGLLATDQSLADWNDPVAFLASLQGDDGALQWKADVPGANFLATVQAVPALAQRTFVDLPVVAAAQPPTVGAADDEATTAETDAVEGGAESDAPTELPETGESQPLTAPLFTLLIGGAALLAAADLRRRAA